MKKKIGLLYGGKSASMKYLSTAKAVTQDRF